MTKRNACANKHDPLVQVVVQHYKVIENNFRAQQTAFGTEFRP